MITGNPPSAGQIKRQEQDMPSNNSLPKSAANPYGRGPWHHAASEVMLPPHIDPGEPREGGKDGVKD